jgi:non-canonical poly(A) RNA polymerase PAPD5/7
MLQEMQQVKEVLIDRLTGLVSELLPNYFVQVYGSHATGLCLHWSDIDLVVGQQTSGEDKEPILPRMQDAKIKDSLRKISDRLKGEVAKHWVLNVLYIDQATVPVIKIKISLRQLMLQGGLPFPKNPKYEAIYNQVFSIDITHMTEMHNGVKCVNLVKEYLLDCWFIEPLILVLKQMLKVNGLNDPYKGGLSSYGLLLMIVAFIQFRKLNNVRVPGAINLGNILLDFLHYYGEVLVYHEYGIMCRRPLDRVEAANFYPRLAENLYGPSTVPCIDDPLSPQNNVGKSTF